MSPVLTVPNATEILPAIKQQVFLGGTLRTDCHVITSSETSAQIVFPGADYDAELLKENTLVEIKAPPYGILFRGYITRRTSAATGGVAFEALDYLSKLQDQHFVQNYRYRDRVNPSTIKFNFNIRQIADIAHLLYLDWQTNTTPGDFLLDFDLSTFPSTFPDLGTANLRGKNLMSGLLQLLRQIDFRYALKVEHKETRSVVSAYVLGSGTKRNIVRATDPTVSPADQIHGEANVLSILKDVNSANTVSHVYGEGDNRKHEKAFDLTANYPTSTPEILNNLEKYTNEDSPDYLQVNERIARYFTIPTIEDDADANAQVQVESSLVQTWEGNTLKPFVVYKKVGDSTFYVKHEGFSISENQNVVFDEPFLDTLTHVELEGLDFSFDGYNDGDNTTNLSLDKNVENLIDDIDDLIASDDKLWFFQGEKMGYYQITAYDGSDITVQGNLDEHEHESWIIVNKRFQEKVATNGVGATNGRYQIDGGGQDTTFTNEYAGWYLVIGEMDASLHWEDNIDVLGMYRIRANTEKYLYLDTTDTVVGASSEYQIINPRFDTKQEFTFLALNAAFKSKEKLQSTIEASLVLENKRVIYKSNTSFKLETETGNYRLSGDGNTATLHAGPTDTTDDTAALETWAAFQLAGINNFEVTYDVSLPTFQVDINVGDRLIDNEFDHNVTVTSRTINYKTGVVKIRARSF